MTNDKIIKMLNSQLNKELFSSYLYLAIANYYEDNSLEGFANWFEIQAKEELDHALLFRKQLVNSGTHVTFEKIESPDRKFTQPGEPLTAALAHEKMISASIDEIYFTAQESKDSKTMQFLNWFIAEQGEEEKNAKDLCMKYEMFGNDAKGLYLLNAELLTRVYSQPSLVL